MTGRRTSAVLGMVFLLAADAAAQRRPAPSVEAPVRLYQLRGHVRLAQNETGVEMIRVELRHFTGEVVGTTFTRQNGEFEFAGVPNGTYQLIVEEKGYEPVRETIEIMGSSRLGILLYLRKPAAIHQESGTSVSARELALSHKARENFRKGLEKLYARKEFAASLSLFQKTLAEAPAFYEAQYHQGIALMELGRLPEAEQAFRSCLSQAPSSFAEPHFALASLLSNQRRFAEAETASRAGLEINPLMWQGHYELARALMGLNRTDEAEVAAQVALKHNPTFAPLHLLVANIHIRRKNYPALLQALDEFLRLQPAGAMSDHARSVRAQVVKQLSQAKTAPPAPPQ